MSLYLPVSIGEALDKFSILSIKLKQIQDAPRRTQVQKEYDALAPLVLPYIAANERLYARLEQCNERLWHLVDAARDAPDRSDPRILYENDARFRIKRKINQCTASVLQEQKNFHDDPLLVRIDFPLTPEVVSVLEELSIYCDGLHCYLSIDSGLTSTDPDIVFHPAATMPTHTGVVVKHMDFLVHWLNTYRSIQTDKNRP